MQPVLVVHGGAWDIPPDLGEGLREGCEAAARTGFATLRGGGSALDAVEAAVRALEDDPRFNAGCGSCLTRDGTIEVDASVMTGDGRAGAVGAVPNVGHAVTLARRVMETGENVLLVGEGALRFAREVGIEPETREALLTPRAFARYQEAARTAHVVSAAPGDTVGAVALDAAGGLAAATSTGGIAFKRPGRVGDSPILGAGTWADERFGAASATGHGESIMRALLAREAIDRLRAGADATAAARAAIGELAARTRGRAGLIVVDTNGSVGMAHNTSGMSFAVARAGAVVASGAKIVAG
ncbi:MAG: isoaspartyl peptidase/L-asparaginase [Myxococcota bacterium]